MLTKHVIERNQERKLCIPEYIIQNLAKRCPTDTALILYQFDHIVNNSCLDYYSRTESNGDLLVLIVRGQMPITLMFRRSDQDNTESGLRVKEFHNISYMFDIIGEN